MSRRVKASTFFKSNLRLLRKMSGLTQSKFAENVGLKRNNIASYEAGFAEPSHDNLKKIAANLQVSVHELISEDLSVRKVDLLSPATQQKVPTKFDMSTFIWSTQQVQKILDGISAYYSFKKDSEASSLPGDSVKLISILESLMETNWKLIRAIENSNSPLDTPEFES